MCRFGASVSSSVRQGLRPNTGCVKWGLGPHPHEMSPWTAPATITAAALSTFTSATLSSEPLPARQGALVLESPAAHQRVTRLYLGGPRQGLHPEVMGPDLSPGPGQLPWSLCKRRSRDRCGRPLPTISAEGPDTLLSAPRDLM